MGKLVNELWEALENAVRDDCRHSTSGEMGHVQGPSILPFHLWPTQSRVLDFKEFFIRETQRVLDRNGITN